MCYKYTYELINIRILYIENGKLKKLWGISIMKKQFKIMVMFLSFVLLLAACGKSNEMSSNSSKNDKVLKMATSADFKPFESRDKEGNIVGFDIDLANLIADELGYKLEIQDMNFDGLIGALQSKRVDMVMAGMSTTEKRKKNVDFSKEYHRSGEMFLSLPDKKIESLESLEGKTVGVQLGTIQEEGANELSKNMDLRLNLLIMQACSFKNYYQTVWMPFIWIVLWLLVTEMNKDYLGLMTRQLALRVWQLPSLKAVTLLMM